MCVPVFVGGEDKRNPPGMLFEAAALRGTVSERFFVRELLKAFVASTRVVLALYPLGTSPHQRRDERARIYGRPTVRTNHDFEQS